LALFIGSVLNHALYVLFHDITHLSCFSSVISNEILAIIANLPHVIPAAISFGRYHRDHHIHFGHSIKDADIPHFSEIKWLNYTPIRILAVLCLPLFYALRPLFKKPKKVNLMEIVNILSCICYAFIVIKLFSYNCLYYLLLSTWFGLSIHPCAAHVIAEHYEFNKNQDTYSYYGVLNYVNFNVGYHIEHHDFPNIPWFNLPKLRKMAPEFYENLPQIDSYCEVLFIFLFDGSIGPWSRIITDQSIN